MAPDIQCPSTHCKQELAAFLREDLPHLFEDQGIDASRYDDAVVFEDPITYYTNIKGDIKAARLFTASPQPLS